LDCEVCQEAKVKDKLQCVGYQELNDLALVSYPLHYIAKLKAAGGDELHLVVGLVFEGIYNKAGRIILRLHQRDETKS
jgi:hypothetical protein